MNNCCSFLCVELLTILSLLFSVWRNNIILTQTQVLTVNISVLLSVCYVLTYASNHNLKCPKPRTVFWQFFYVMASTDLGLESITALASPSWLESLTLTLKVTALAMHSGQTLVSLSLTFIVLRPWPLPWDLYHWPWQFGIDIGVSPDICIVCFGPYACPCLVFSTALLLTKTCVRTHCWSPQL